MWKNIDYENSIEPAMEQLRRTDRRCEKYEEKRVDNWGPDWQTEMDGSQTLLVGVSSGNMSGAIRRLSDKMTPAAVGKYVADAIQYRLTNWRRGQRNTTFATTTDFLNVLKHMTVTPLISCGAGAGVVTRSKKRTEGAARKVNSEDDDEERAEEEEDVDVQVDKYEDVEMSDASVDEEPVARKCGCANRPVVLAQLATTKKHGFIDRSKIIQDIEFLTSGAVNKMCWPHLRRCAAIVGLQRQIGGRNTLVKTVKELWKRRFQFGEIITENRDWFAKTVRGESPNADLGTLRFQPTETPSIIFHNKVMLERFLGCDAAQEWEEHGTTVVRGAMKWLFTDPEIAELLNHEIHMYMHYRQMVNGQKSLGWLRSGYFLHIQHIAKQDPSHYALVAITSGNLWQISFPYYLKSILQGDGIAFQHIDLNGKRIVECRRGSSRIQTSLTLTQEDDENCTFVVPGFHRKLPQWWTDVLIPEDSGVINRAASDHNGNCLKTNDLYRVKIGKNMVISWRQCVDLVTFVCRGLRLYTVPSQEKMEKVEECVGL